MKVMIHLTRIRLGKTGSFGSDSEKILTDQSKGDASLTEEIEKTLLMKEKVKAQLMMIQT